MSRVFGLRDGRRGCRCGAAEGTAGDGVSSIFVSSSQVFKIPDPSVEFCREYVFYKRVQRPRCGLMVSELMSY